MHKLATSKQQNSNTDQLISSVSQAWNGLTDKYIKKTCSKFQSWVEIVITAEGSFAKREISTICAFKTTNSDTQKFGLAQEAVKLTNIDLT